MFIDDINPIMNTEMMNSLYMPVKVNQLSPSRIKRHATWYGVKIVQLLLKPVLFLNNL